MNKANFYKGCIEPIILQLLKEHGKMYGYEITQHVKEKTQGELQLTEGALYPLLHRLEAEGFLNVEMVNIGNRIRKYYSLTKTGKKQAFSAINELCTLLKTLQNLVKTEVN